MKRPSPAQRAAAIAALALLGAVGAFATIAPQGAPELLVGKTATLEPVALEGRAVTLPEPSSYIRGEQFHSGETLAALLSRFKIWDPDARALRSMPVMRLLQPGVTVTAEVGAGGALAWMRFVVARDLVVRVECVDGVLTARAIRVEPSTRAERKSAEIRSSLFAATDAAGIPDAVAMQLADIFGGDIDFYRDLRKGDRFSVVYDVYEVDGRPVRSGRVLAAEFVNQGRTLRAVAFGSGYYSPDGRNMRKAFLRAPLEFSRVSSGFGMRKHPFLHTWRKHTGVDYAAPIGTRVRATSDGVVEFAGRKGGYGNCIILRHQGAYSTLYGHLSRIARGIRRGAHVTQGETIGAVGQTGWATGPHLHYEFRIAGVARNPLAVALPAGLPVPRGEMSAFLAEARPLLGQLDLLAQTRLASRE